jgi:uncharacterized protein (DUF1501 family)
MSTSRRRFLAAVSAASATSGLLSLSPLAPRFLTESAAWGAEQAGEKILVVVQLSGGNDGINTVVPYRDDRYIKARPSLVQGEGAVLKIGNDLGLHPNLRGFEKLLEAKQLAIVQGVGYPNPNRSHFESMDIWHTCRHDVPGAKVKPDRSTGWLGRSLDARKEAGNADSALALHLGQEVQPLALAGRLVQCPSIRSLDQFRLDTAGNQARRQLIESAISPARTVENDLLRFVSARSTGALEVSRRMESAGENYKTDVAYPQTGLAEKMKQIAQLIDAGLGTRIYYVALDGFDTHSDQAGAHAALLDQLGGALAAFAEDLGKHGHLDRVATLVFSEFGRRVKENASRGTDHGAAAPVFVVGSKVKPGLLGKHPDLSDLDDGDLKHHTDFRSIYAALLQNWLGWPIEAALAGKFKPYELFA